MTSYQTDITRYVTSGRSVAVDDLHVNRIGDEVHISIARHSWAMSAGDFMDMVLCVTTVSALAQRAASGGPVQLPPHDPTRPVSAGSWVFGCRCERCCAAWNERKSGKKARP